MSPRPRTVEDAQILAAAARVIGRVGPSKITLALVTEEVGLAPATLIQRFGSKRELLLALARAGTGDDKEFVSRLRHEHSSPLQVLREYLLSFARMASTPEEVANHLAFFQMDLADPEFRKLTRKILRANEATVVGLLEETLEAGELTHCDPRDLAPVLTIVAQGSLLSWAIHRKGTARRWVARHLQTCFEPYLAARR